MPGLHANTASLSRSNLYYLQILAFRVFWEPVLHRCQGQSGMERELAMGSGDLMEWRELAMGMEILCCACSTVRTGGIFFSSSSTIKACIQLHVAFSIILLIPVD